MVTVSESEFVCALSPALLGAVTIEVLVSGERAACSTGSACEFLLRAPQPKSQRLGAVDPTRSLCEMLQAQGGVGAVGRRTRAARSVGRHGLAMRSVGVVMVGFGCAHLATTLYDVFAARPKYFAPVHKWKSPGLDSRGISPVDI